MRYLPAELRLPGVCQGCRAPVEFDGKRWKDAGVRRVRSHRCPEARPVCGAWMPKARERCARRPGHSPVDHRTRWAMDNALAMTTGRRAA